MHLHICVLYSLYSKPSSKSFAFCNFPIPAPLAWQMNKKDREGSISTAHQFPQSLNGCLGRTHNSLSMFCPRIECLKLFVASTLLMCADDVERVELLNKWIQVAGDTKTALGNLYGFTGIMQGLAMSQVICRLLYSSLL